MKLLPVAFGVMLGALTPESVTQRLGMGPSPELYDVINNWVANAASTRLAP